MIVKGRIYDVESGTPVPGAYVIPLDGGGKEMGSRATVTDPWGNYQIDVQPGQMIKAKMLGFKEVIKPAALTLNFGLTSGLDLSGVTITACKDPLKVFDPQKERCRYAVDKVWDRHKRFVGPSLIGLAAIFAIIAYTNR